MSITKKTQKGKSNQVIFITALVTAFSLLGDSMLYIVLPIYWKEIGLDSFWQIGILLSINRFVRLPFNPIAGWVYKRISLKTGMMIAVILGTITTLGYGIFQGFMAWLILRMIWGVAWSFFRIGGLSIVAHHAEESRRGEAMGLYNGIYRLGSLFGMLLGGILVPLVGLSPVAIIFGLLTLIGLPLLSFSLKTEDRGKREETNAERRRFFPQLSRLKVLVIISGFFVTMLIQGVFTSTLSSVIEFFYGSSISLFGIVVSVTLLSGGIQAVRWAWEPFLGRKFGLWSDGPRGRFPLYIGSLFLAAISFGLISSNLPFWLWIIIVLVSMITATSITTITDALCLDATKNINVVSFLTLYTVVQDVGAALGPFLSYFIIEFEGGYYYLYWGGGFIFALLGVLWVVEYYKNHHKVR
ncbi:MFS transporter [Cytobacillus purgationiresistens]|uniref:MFS family permease n=1 Tax=Cytobacillus purgationiresistens TaxID=863449 RepID=A0ABU0API8_9BACI|nr:MFS transporter [Cytobacillus purgationiresistens]MDQ0273191.1 MFS family permease [Cytobacillus purgationiresistens]